MAHFVLVAGAWHGGWCWERLTPLLEIAGHSVDAPDLLGMGSDPTPLHEVTLARWTRQVADFVLARPEPVILVGHSRGGIVISQVAELLPDRVAWLAYLAAFLLPDGATLAATAAPADGGILVIVPGTQGGIAVRDGAVASLFYNTTDPAGVAHARAMIGEEPAGSFTTPVRTTAAAFGRVPRAYIECTEDRAVPLALQRSMQAQLPCDPVYTMAADHSPFFSAPQELTRHLTSLAERTT